MSSSIARIRCQSVFAVVVALATACSNEVSPAKGNPTGVGNACTKNEDCATKNCYVGQAGGYCTTNCADEGSTEQCPVDTVCKPIQGGAARCLLVCGSVTRCGSEPTCPDSVCPPASTCVPVANAKVRACEPNPR